MSKFTFQHQAPENWDQLCQRRDAFFGSSEWQSFIEASFPCRTIYGSNGEHGVAITVFAAGPFNVGYLGFPSGSFDGESMNLKGLLNDFRRSGISPAPVCLRISPSAFSKTQALDLNFVENPETAISDLQNWDCLEVSKKLRRDLKKVEKSGLSCFEVSEPTLAAEMFRMYEATVQRNKGAMRYTEEYFSGLIQLSTRDSRVGITGVRKDHRLAGFAVIIRDRNTSFYLHGGTEPDFRNVSPSDFLLRQAINTAKSAGSTCFNFMASPPGQPMLVRYKEKWGAETRLLKTYTLANSRLFPAFLLAEKAYRAFS